MKQTGRHANRRPRNVSGETFAALYMTTTGLHYEYITVGIEQEEQAHIYACKEAQQNGATLESFNPSQVPMSLTHNESHTCL